MKKHISAQDITAMETQQRIHFINSIGGFKSIALIGTQNNQQQTNLAIFSSVIHIGSNPALFGIISRPASVERHTLNNILESGFYTLNHINKDIYIQAHQTSARYDKEASEFDVTGLETEYKNNFLAPFVAQSNVQLAMVFKQKIDLEINNTVLIIGEVHAVYFPENCQQADGFLDLEKANTITCTGLDSYHTTQKINRLSYAKPNKEIIIL
ncbi:MAG: hypothetical protein QG594_970 [Bacteroidota bacterium]|nr:hypothetical protein [Bacteroidota bacterium]